MDTIGLTKTFSIQYDPVKGAIDYKNDDDMSYAEVLGAIEYAKMMIMKEWLDQLKEE